MSSAALAPTPSEDILSAKTDLAISNAIVKAGLGLGGGILASAILFRRRPWPVLMGIGFGLGQGYSDAERIFNPAAIPGFVIAPAFPSSPSPPAASSSSPFGLIDSTIEAVKKEASKIGKEVAVVDEKITQEVKKVEEKIVEAAKKEEKSQKRI